MDKPLQIPVELPIEAVKQYVIGETLTPYNFDLLQNYFEGRIIKLLEETDLLTTIEGGQIYDYAVDAIKIIKEEAE